MTTSSIPSPSRRVVTDDLRGLCIPGVLVAVDPDEADRLGAFSEDALSAEDALEAQDEA